MNKRIILCLFWLGIMFTYHVSIYADTGAYSEDLSVYPVSGGNIYYDAAQGIIMDSDKTITSAVIPESINGVTITGIGDNAFGLCWDMISLSVLHQSYRGYYTKKRNRNIRPCLCQLQGTGKSYSTHRHYSFRQRVFLLLHKP